MIFSQDISYDDTGIRQTYNHALNLMGEQRFNDSAQIIRTLIQKKPDFLEAFSLIVILHEKMECPDDVCHYLEGMISDTSRAVGALYGLGVFYQNKQDYPKAIEFFKNALEHGRRHHLIYRSLVDCCQKSNQLSDCRLYLQKSMSADSLNLTLNFALGYLKTADKKYTEAVFYFDRVYPPDDSFIYAKIEKTQALFQKGEFKTCESLCLYTLKLIRKKEWKEEEGRLLNMLGNLKSEMGDIREALTHYTLAARLYKQIGFIKHQFVIQLNVAMIQNRLGQYDEALKSLSECKSFLEIEKDTAQYSACLLQIGWVYFNQTMYDSALTYLIPAAELSEQTDDLRFAAYCNRFLGLIEQNKGNIFKALDCFRQAFQFARRIDNIDEQARNMNTMGRIFYEIGRMDSSRICYQLALKLHHQSGNQLFVAHVLGNMAMIENASGHYSKGLEYYEKALKLSREVGEKQAEIRYLENVGVCYQKLGDLKAAKQYLHQALILARLLNAGEREVNLLFNISHIYYSVGQTDSALICLNEGLQLSCNLGLVPNEIQIRSQLGYIYQELGRFREAESQLTLSLLLAERSQNARRIPDILLNIGRLNRKQKAFDQSKKASLRALKITERLKDIPQMIRACRELGRLYQELDSLMTAQAYYRKAIDHIEQIRGGIAGQELRVLYFEEKTRLYDELIHILAELNRRDPQENYIEVAFRFAEQSKSRILLDLFYLNKTSLDQNIPLKLMEEYSKAEQNLYTLQSRLYAAIFQQESRISSLDSLEKSLSAAKNKFEKIQEKVDRCRWKELPGLSQIQPLTVQKICDRIATPGRVLIEYAIGMNHSYAFIVRDRHIAMADIALTESDIQSAVEEIRRPLIEIEDPLAIMFDIDKAHELYCQLVKPIEPYLNKGDELLIIPDDALFYLPFEVLVVDPRSKTDESVSKWYSNYEHSTYLIENYPISYACSASLLDPRFFQLHEAFEGDNLLAIGMAFRGLNNPLTFATRQEGRSFRPLPFSTYEIEQISGSFKEVHMLIGIDAKEETIKETAGDYRVLHFSTHGILDERQPLYSGLVLAMDADSAEDGYLQVFEIVNMKLKADLVTLSACNTGLGALKQGEGVIGLTHAFLSAGAHSVVVSLWNVSDVSTAQLMTNFYHYLEQGKSKAEALRQAKINLIKTTGNMGGVQISYAHPFFWAPFILVGDAQPTHASETGYSFLWFWFFGSGVILSSLICYFIFFNNRRALVKKGS